jgi:hypothetical protein
MKCGLDILGSSNQLTLPIPFIVDVISAPLKQGVVGKGGGGEVRTTTSQKLDSLLCLGLKLDIQFGRTSFKCRK